MILNISNREEFYRDVKRDETFSQIIYKCKKLNFPVPFHIATNHYHQIFYVYIYTICNAI